MLPSAYVHLAIVYIVWGTVYPVIRVTLTGTNPLTPLQLQGGRLLLAAILLALPLAWRRTLPSVTLRDLGLCVACGLLFWVTGNGLATLALRQLPAAFVTMAMAAIPLWTAVFQFFLDRQPIARVEIISLALGFVGLAIVYVPAVTGIDQSELNKPLELCAAFLAPLTWALGSILQRPLRSSMRPETAASLQLAVGGLACILLAAIDGSPLPPQLSNIEILAFAYLVVFVGALCFSSYVRVTRLFPAYIGATFAYVNPIIGIALAAILLGERPSTISLIGMVVVIMSVAVLLWHARPIGSRDTKPLANG